MDFKGWRQRHYLNKCLCDEKRSDKGMKYKKYTKVVLADGRTATVVEYLGDDYVVDVDLSDDYDTILVKDEEIKGVDTLDLAV